MSEMRMNLNSRIWRWSLLSIAVLGTAVGLPLFAQTTPDAAAFQNQFPDPVQYKPPVPDAPSLELRKVLELSIPGPLTGALRIHAGRLEIPTAQGLFCSGWNENAVPEPCAAPPLALSDEPDWVHSEDATYRISTARLDRIVAQKICRRCKRGWRKRWRLRVPGLAAARPLVTGRRVYFGAADNRVFGVRRHNGHRLWATPLDGQVLRPLTLWVDPDPHQPGGAVAAILAIPEPGNEMVVIDAMGGRLAQNYRLPDADDKLIGSAVATPEGYVVLARQGYAPEDATLIILELQHPGPTEDEPVKKEPTGYTSPAQDGATPDSPTSEMPTRVWPRD